MNRRGVTRRGLVLAVGLVSLALLTAGCGGSNSASVASIATTTSGSAAGNATARGGAASSGPAPSQAHLQQSLLKYARCMRANDVPGFPDPSAAGGFEFQPGDGVDPSSPSFRAAQAKCQKLVLGGGLPSAGSTTHPSAQALAQMVRVAQCMRRHGISGFPDPTTSVPSGPPAGGGVISDRDGVILVLPSSLDMQSPLFLRAAAACGFQLTNH